MPRPTPSRPNSDAGRSEQLSAKGQLNLIASIAADMSKCGLKPLSSAVLVALACRGLMPEKLVGLPAGWLLERISRDYFDIATLQIDKSELANSLLFGCDSREDELFDPTLLNTCNFDESKRAMANFEKFSDCFSKPMVRKAIDDPLFCGWLYQTILMGRKEDYSHSRKQKSVNDLSRITQWFTPKWICNFLLDEGFRDCDNLSTNSDSNESKSSENCSDFKTLTFLDSACGAGHILAPALLRLLSKRLQAPKLQSNEDRLNVPLKLNSPEDRNRGFEETVGFASSKDCGQHLVDEHLSAILSSQLYGLDTDPLMVRLSGLAIYLTCRDVSRTAPLPIPLIFSFQNVSTHDLSRSTPHKSIDKPARISGSFKALEFGEATDTKGDTANQSDSNLTNGSLLIALNPRPENVLLRRIDGTTMKLDSLPKTFDVQALNPPYLSHRLMPESSGKFLRENYDGSQYDLYTAFLELSIRLMSKHGGLALICQQSFLSTSRFEHLRREMVERCHINSIVQLGAGTFASRGGEKVSNAIISLSRKTDVKDTHQLSVYKLVSASAKQEAEQTGVNEYVKQIISEQELLSSTRMIPGFPLVPFCPREVAALFETHSTIAQSDNGIILTNGLFTCDNKRFVRHFSELGEEERSSFVPYDKGGGQKWYSTTPYLLEWTNDGDDIRQFRFQRGQSKALPGERFYFQHGITYSYIGTKGFKARLLSPGSVFDIASSAMFSEQIDLFYLLGFLNSALIRFILGMLNPTVNFQIGDLRRIPFCAPLQKIEIEVARLAKEAVGLAREAETFDSGSPAYNRALITEKIRSRVSKINHSELRLQNEIDEAIFDLYKISDTTRDIIRKNEWVVRTQGDLVQMPS